MSHRSRQRGFTLLEVMVALAVLAIGMSALIKASSSATANTAYLNERTLASWVASNVLTELQLSGQFPALGDKRGTTLMANHEWHWQMKVIKTELPTMHKVEVAVRSREESERPVSTLTGFVGKSVTQTTP